MEILHSKGRKWIIRYKTEEYPGEKLRPSYFATPIGYNGETGKIELLQADTNWCHSGIFKNDLTKKEIEELKEDTQRCYNSAKRRFKQYFDDSEEKEFYLKILNFPK